MIPVIHNLTPESREILKRQVEANFPESGIAGFYCRSGNVSGRVHLEIRCMRTLERKTIAVFEPHMLLVNAMPLLIAVMNECRCAHQRGETIAITPISENVRERLRAKRLRVKADKALQAKLNAYYEKVKDPDYYAMPRKAQTQSSLRGL